MTDPQFEGRTAKENENWETIKKWWASMAPQPSPAAQAVLDAYHNADIDNAVTTAAVLRAAALYCKRDRIQLLAIADELEALSDD